MTGKERIGNILKHKPVDRIGLFEHFWDDTRKEYVEKGWVKEGESMEDHFGLDAQECWPFNITIDMDFMPEVVAEDEDTITVKDGNGAILRRQKYQDCTPEHVGFTITCREEWEAVKEKLTVDESRINFEAYRKGKAEADKEGRFFMWSGVNVFECMHPVVGHENLLVGMALDPEWILDMADTYARLTMDMQEILFGREGRPDGIWYYEDMGYKDHPFMSPAMYEELIQPSHKKTIDFAHSMNLPVIMHSCGFVEPLLPGMIEAGIDCYQAIEIKAGMDILKLHRDFGEKIALMGGMDARVIISNDKDKINTLLEETIPTLKKGFGYCLHSDHSIPKNVTEDTLKFFQERGLELGKY